MQYVPLEKIYWKAPDKHEAEYQSRFNNPLTEHFDIDIKHFQRRNAYPAFFCVTKELLFLMEQIYSEHEKLLALINHVPAIVLRQFSLLCIVDEIKSSNDIEGVHRSRRELHDAIDKAGNNSRFETTVQKYELLLAREKIDFSNSVALRKFYDEFAHKEVIAAKASNRLDGSIFRKGPVDIDSGTGKTVHRGVFPEERVINYMNKTLDIMNSNDFPVIISTALSHYFFEYIHPFYDGNGRTARFLASYNLSKTLSVVVSMRLSVTIKRMRSKYYRMFKNTECEHNRGDITPFVINFMELLIQVIQDSMGLLARKMNQYNKCIEKLNNISDDSLTQQIYLYLFQSSMLYGQGLRASELADILNKSRNTITNRLDNMPSDHIIKVTSGRKKYFKLNLLILREFI